MNLHFEQLLPVESQNSQPVPPSKLGTYPSTTSVCSSTSCFSYFTTTSTVPKTLTISSVYVRRFTLAVPICGLLLHRISINDAFVDFFIDDRSCNAGVNLHACLNIFSCRLTRYGSLSFAAR